MYDWYIDHLQSPALGRDATGRYTLQLMQTTVVMRPDAAPGFVGTPYDTP